MSLAKKLIVTGIFILILLVLATADAIFTSDTRVMPSTDGVADQPEPSVLATAASHGFVVLETSEESLMEKSLTPSPSVNARVLLMDDDRVAYVAWTDSPRVQEYFASLKDGLHDAFSSELRDLVDERQSQPGVATRDVLAFHDPAIHTDHLVFARVRNRLYEFHVTPGKEAPIDRLLDALTE